MVFFLACKFFLSFTQCNFLFINMTSSSSSSSNPRPYPRTINEIFIDYCARRTAVICALTQEIGRFYELCDPGKEELCLYGHPNEVWEVKQPVELVPPTLPEPSPGINFGRDVLNNIDWINLVALHSNSWLLSMAFHHGARLDRNEREKLFLLINGLPTIIDAVKDHFKSATDKPAVASGRKSRGRTKRTREGDLKRILKNIQEMHDKEIPCGLCGKRDYVDTFWIACDKCFRWFHGVCVDVSPELAEKINKYKCPPCRLIRD